MIPNPLDAAGQLGRVVWRVTQDAVGGLAAQATSFAEFVGTTSTRNAQAGLEAIHLHEVVAKRVWPCLKNADVDRREAALVIAGVASDLGDQLKANGVVIQFAPRVAASDVLDPGLPTSTCSR